MDFKITVVGLGLMGASLAQALQGFKNARITGVDNNPQVLEIARERQMVHHCTPDIVEGIQDADLVIFCVYAHHIPALLAQCQHHLKPGAVVSDICGVKHTLYQKILPGLPGHIQYIGVHPMAGGERDGIAFARADLYRGSGFLICTTGDTSPASIALAEEMGRHIGAVRMKTVPYQEHDAIIAYTSDLMHISAAALCLHTHPQMDLTFTAGAFRDCTRIADINANAWTELLLDNQAHVLEVLGRYIQDLGSMHTAIQNQDAPALEQLLQQAGDNKREMLTK